MELKEMAKSSEARIRASAKYNKAHTKQIPFVLNIDTDADVIEHLSKQGSRRAYLLNLIREDMAKSKLKAYARFESEESGDDGYTEVDLEANFSKAVDVMTDTYKALPGFVQDQVTTLGITDGDTDIDIIEVAIGQDILKG